MVRAFDGDLADANARARALRASLGARAFGEVEDVVGGARSVLVVLRPGLEPGDALRAALEEDVERAATESGRLHTFDVDYDGEDLEAWARTCGMTTDEAIAMYAGSTYTVAFLGFSPGFAYLLGLPDALRAPRLPTPRARVPAGSVAVADTYTAVYPSTTPGGWRLIGRTDAVLFDTSADPPAMLAPGDTVRFVSR
jgi:KipI family sensor histidine kinase inhibitor